MRPSLDESEFPSPNLLMADEIASIRAAIDDKIPESEIVKALIAAGNNPDRALGFLLDDDQTNLVKQEEEVIAQLPIESLNDDLEHKMFVKEEEQELGFDQNPVLASETRVKMEECDLCFGKIVKKEDVVSEISSLEPKGVVKEEEQDLGIDQNPILVPETRVNKKEECDLGFEKVVQNEEVVSEISSLEPKIVVKEEQVVGIQKNPILGIETKIEKEELEDIAVEEVSDNLDLLEPKSVFNKKKQQMGIYKDSFFMPKANAKKGNYEDCEEALATSHCVPYLNPRPIRAIGPDLVTDRRIQVVQEVGYAEFAEFPEEDDWFLLGRTYVSGLSTCRGRRKIDADEIVYFTFPKNDVKRQYGRKWVSVKTVIATSEIVRFSTKRSGEIGRLPAEWSRCLIPLVNSSKVKVKGRCVIAPSELSLMQEIMLYVSFYIHSKVFTEGDKLSWKLDAPKPVDSSACPLPTLLKLLKIKPFQKAEFTPEELDSRKRSLDLRDNGDDDDDESEPIVGLAKRRRGGMTYAEQSNDEQAISESSLNKLVGTVDVYDLKEAEPPSTLLCNLWPYQKQALHWMLGLEKGLDVEQAEKTLHPCWAAYRVCDKRASAIYANIFTGEHMTEFPSATQMARGGILADAMGLGKTVMTIALVLSKPRGRPEDEDTVMDNTEEELNQTRKPSSIKGGTLIVCPMALLGQWKDELETHSRPNSISVFVHYGGDRTTDPREIAKYDVLLTTYGVLASAFKSGSENTSIFHRIDWYRVVLDEAHTIKSPKARVSQSAFALSSHCRWCLTGTPLQNNLEDLYSLLCFLHVQPWCNWPWWHKLIQSPYENGDERGLRLVKAILRPLMLRRTKDTKDKDGRPILVLPPANVQIVECEQSEAERDFYDALFRRSKVRFDQFVAQGKVFHNYASILELLLRLRQCCNHPFLVVSRSDNQEHADLNKLARRFLDGSNASSALSKSYVEEVIEGLRRGDVTECPICLESASDDPVLTPCAHRMCRECLLASWWTPTGGPCPICRKALTKADLITCPSENMFQVDVKKNWKESSKVTELIRCIESIERSGSGEKSIVFSQWTSFLDLLEIPLHRRNIGYLRFDGKLSQRNRERILKEFNEDKDKLILLMSLKAGGVGLNLTTASNVFLMDPWWNPAVEEQAIMRIHRIGQKRQVRVRRFIVKDTVEERMHQVQARKQRMIAGALTDEEVRTARIEELKMLFR